MPFNPKSLSNLKPGNKRGKAKSPYTISDLMDILRKVEKGITKKSGTPFNFLEFITQQAIKGNERLQIALLDRICPATKQVALEHSGDIKHAINLGDYGLTDDTVEKYAEGLLAKRRTNAIKENIN